VSFECFYHEKLRVNFVTMHNDFNARDCLSVAESAVCFGVSDTTVYRLIYAGKLKVITGFGRLRVRRSDLESLLNETAVYVPKARKRTKTADPVAA
jgi:excisionase family DNA binding protein